MTKEHVSETKREESSRKGVFHHFKYLRKVRRTENLRTATKIHSKKSQHFQELDERKYQIMKVLGISS